MDQFENTDSGNFPFAPGKSIYDGWPLVSETIPIDDEDFDEMGARIKDREQIGMKYENPADFDIPLD